MSDYPKVIVDLLKVKYEQSGWAGVNGFLKSNKIKHEIVIEEFKRNLPSIRRITAYYNANKWIKEAPRDEFRAYYHSKNHHNVRAKSVKILDRERYTEGND